MENDYIFYVGKGCGARASRVCESSRNKYFLRYYNKYKCDYRIIAENMTEENALKFEYENIVKYKKIGMCCCNFDNGGRNGASLHGELNGMFGKTHSKETRDFLSKINSDGRNAGKNNTQYNISPKERMDKDIYNTWRQKQKLRKFGKTNPNYGNDTLKKKYKENPILAKEKQSRPATQNGMAKPITMYDSNMKLIKHFSFIEECVDYIINHNLTKTKNRSAIRCGIYNSNQYKKKYYSYYFIY